MVVKHELSLVLGLEINLHPYPHLWAMGSDQMNKAATTCEVNVRFLCRAAGLTLQIKRNQSRWFGYLMRTPSSQPLLETVSGMSHCMESPGQNHNLLQERLHLIVRCRGFSPGGAVICGHGQRSLGWCSQLVATATTTRKSQRKMNKLIKNKFSLLQQKGVTD